MLNPKRTRSFIATGITIAAIASSNISFAQTGSPCQTTNVFGTSMHYKLKDKNEKLVVTVTEDSLCSCQRNFWGKVIHGNPHLEDMNARVDIVPDSVGARSKTREFTWVQTKVNGKPAATITLADVFAETDRRKATGFIDAGGQTLVFEVSY